MKTVEVRDVVAVRYIGPLDGRNQDVADATGRGALMCPGAKYKVPRELADRLLVTLDFEPASKEDKHVTEG